MKKQYIRYGAVFCIVVLLAFSIAFVIFTKNKIDDFNLHFNLPFVKTLIIMLITLTDSWKSR